MERLREKRYAEKMRHVKERVDDIEEWKNEFLQDEKTKLACYKATQEIIEGCMDLLSMMLKDSNEMPKDDYLNI